MGVKRKYGKGLKTQTTLDEAFEDFVLEKEAGGRSADTIRNYSLSYRLFYEYHELDSNTLLNDLQEKMFFKWIQHMKMEEKRPQTINHYLRDWRTFLNWCAMRDMMETPIALKEIEKQDDMPKMYSDEEIALMIAKPRPGDNFSTWRSWAIVNTVYATGLRASTICAIKFEDINFQREELTIRKQKNKKAGMLPITPALANCLREYIKKFHRDADADDYVFPGIDGGQFNPGALNHSIQRYCKSLGIEGHGIHSIRHNFARDMILNGAGEYRLQKYLQHSNIQMSQHYVKLFSQDLKKDAEDYSPLDVAKRKAGRTSKFKKG